MRLRKVLNQTLNDIKNIAKSLIILVSLSLSAGLCKPTEGFIQGAPATGILLANWKLHKIVTPTRTLTGAQLVHNENLNIKWDSGYHVEKTFRDDSLSNTQYWGTANTPPVIDTKKFTFLITYRYGLKRFYKVHMVVSQPDTLEATAYLSEIGSVEDSVKFFYTQVW